MGSKDYCITCKFAGNSSGGQVKCNLHNKWVDQYGTCNDYIWVKARSHFKSFLTWLATFF